jgi:hypothetical protein
MADLAQAGPRLAGALVLPAGLGARPWDAGQQRDPDTAPAHEQQPVPVKWIAQSTLSKEKECHKGAIIDARWHAFSIMGDGSKPVSN